MVNYGETYNAMLLAVEHRFYGKSQPLPNLSTANLVYLSSEQALADAADFIDAMRQQIDPDAPVITFGCSYPGNLAAWFRIKYPQITMASVASSSPVQATLDFFQYLDVVDISLSYFTGPQCDSLITNATQQIQSMLQTSDGLNSLAALFNFCTPLNASNTADVSTFMSNLMGNWMGTVQYNDELGNPIDIKYLCNIMISNPSDPLNAYAKINSIFLNAQNQTCLDNSYEDSLKVLLNLTASPTGFGARQWTYQTCTEFAYYQTTDSNAQPFGNLVPLSYYTKQCNDAFGFPFNPNVINETNHMYGGKYLPPTGPTNILFVNGEVDPWHALGITQNISPTLTTILIRDTAHCANVLPSSPNDPPDLIAARQATSKQIGMWLKEAENLKQAQPF